MNIREVTPLALADVWPALSGWVNKGLKHGQGDEALESDLFQNVITGRNQLWVVQDEDNIVGGVFFSVHESRVKKVYIDLLVGVRMQDWVDELENLLRDYKDLVGAVCVEGSCRPGLAKLLGERGWKQKAIIMSIV